MFFFFKYLCFYFERNTQIMQIYSEACVYFCYFCRVTPPQRRNASHSLARCEALTYDTVNLLER